MYFTVSFTNTDTFCVVVMFSNSMTVSKTVTCDGARRGTHRRGVRARVLLRFLRRDRAFSSTDTFP